MKEINNNMDYTSNPYPCPSCGEDTCPGCICETCHLDTKNCLCDREEEETLELIEEFN